MNNTTTIIVSMDGGKEFVYKSVVIPRKVKYECRCRDCGNFFEEYT